MTPFLIAALLLTAAVVALVTRPLYLRRAVDPGVDANRLNATLLRDEFAVIEKEHADGLLDDDAWTQARDDLTRRLLDESAPAAAARVAASHPMRTFAAIALLVPLATGLLYAGLGAPTTLLPGATTAAASGGGGGASAGQGGGAASPQQQQQVAQMVQGLAAKLAAKPDDPAGWAMLARSYTVMGRYDDAVAAFGRIGPTLDTNAGWLAEYADALAMQAGGNPVGKPEQLSLQALKVDPDNVLALMMASYGAAARADFNRAIPLIEHALKLVPPDSDDQRFLQDLLGKMQARASGGAATAGASPSTTPATASPAPATATAANATDAMSSAATTTLNLDVSISPALQAEARGKVLFVLARAPGERMPLAVVKLDAGTWPVRVVLDAQSTLDPRRPLASVPKVEVEARVSAGGTPMPAPGDLLGATVLPTGRTVSAALTIDHRRQ